MLSDDSHGLPRIRRCTAFVPSELLLGCITSNENETFMHCLDEWKLRSVSVLCHGYTTIVVAVYSLINVLIIVSIIVAHYA
jgi:hypothetical protein